MKKKTAVFLISAFGLAGLLGGAGIAYSSLIENYAPESVPETVEQSGNAEVQAETAPDFVMRNAAGEEVRMSDFVGKPVLINFWATWCPPCRAELPYFQRAFAEYGDEIEFLMVDETDGTRDTVEGAKAFAEENQYDFPLYFDTQGSGARAYSILSIPMTVFISSEGALTYQHIGAMTEEDLFAVLERQLGNQPERGEIS